MRDYSVQNMSGGNPFEDAASQGERQVRVCEVVDGAPAVEHFAPQAPALHKTHSSFYSHLRVRMGQRESHPQDDTRAADAPPDYYTLLEVDESATADEIRVGPNRSIRYFSS